MNEHPSFTCAREGHVFELLDLTTTIPNVTVFKTCRRCNKIIEEPVPIAKKSLDHRHFFKRDYILGIFPVGEPYCMWCGEVKYNRSQNKQGV